MTGAHPAGEHPDLAELFTSYLDLHWHFDPVSATAEGGAAHDHRLGLFTDERVDQHVAAVQAMVNALEGLSLETVDDEIDRTALLNVARVAISRFTREQPHRRNPDLWVSHALEGLYLLLVRTDRPPDHRRRAAQGRLEAIPPLLDGARATLRRCPTVFVTVARDVLRAGLDLVDQIVEVFGANDPEAFRAAGDAARTALADFDAWLVKHDDGDTSFAIGDQAFDFRLRFEHALNTTAWDVGEYGRRLIAATEAELDKLAGELDPGVPWPDLVARLRADHPAADELVTAYAGEMERARCFVEEHALAPLPDLPLDVIPTPSFLRPVIPFAAYQPPAMFAEGGAGLFYVTAPGPTLSEEEQEGLLRDHAWPEIATTSLHEAFPGHHLQFAWAKQCPRRIRRLMTTAVSVEGWALYCEEMMGEAGYYTPVERFFQLVALLWRAVRVVLDVELHTGGMDVETAIGTLMRHVHFDRRHAEVEVRRYCAAPTYQLCYAVGRRELLDLRRDMQSAMGDAFDLAHFHERVLGFGGLPVTLMRWGMNLT